MSNVKLFDGASCPRAGFQGLVLGTIVSAMLTRAGQGPVATARAEGLGTLGPVVWFGFDRSESFWDSGWCVRHLFESVKNGVGGGRIYSSCKFEVGAKGF